MQILLKDIQLHGYHGVHPHEKVTGTHFTVDITIEIEDSVNPIGLENTIDYALVFRLLKVEFSQTEDLLENLAHRILKKIFTTFTMAQKIDIVILKNNAPLSGFQGKVGVRLSQERTEIIS